VTQYIPEACHLHYHTRFVIKLIGPARGCGPQVKNRSEPDAYGHCMSFYFLLFLDKPVSDTRVHWPQSVLFTVPRETSNKHKGHWPKYQTLWVLLPSTLQTVTPCYITDITCKAHCAARKCFALSRGICFKKNKYTLTL
jgi:hypothetical protein